MVVMTEGMREEMVLWRKEKDGGGEMMMMMMPCNEEEKATIFSQREKENWYQIEGLGIDHYKAKK